MIRLLTGDCREVLRTLARVELAISVSTGNLCLCFHPGLVSSVFAATPQRQEHYSTMAGGAQ